MIRPGPLDEVKILPSLLSTNGSTVLATVTDLSRDVNGSDSGQVTLFYYFS
jgi:hypothetical protein